MDSLTVSLNTSRAVKDSDSVTNIEDIEEEDASTSMSDVTLLDVPWEQVLCQNILPYLSIPQLFRLRSVSHSCLCLVDTYFSLQLHLSICHLGKKLTSEAFSLMTRESRCLKTLFLRGAKYGLNNEVFLPVLANNARLEKIDISGCTSLSGCVLYAIGVNCRKLKQLIVRDCVTFMEENFLSFLCVKQPVHLEYLDISGCWNLGDDLLIKLVQRCPNQGYISVSYGDFQLHLSICHLGKKLTSEAFSLMTRESRCLKTLFLRGAKYGLNNEVFLPVLANNARLEKIDISGCTSLSGCVLYAIGVNCRKLKQLIVRDCVTFMEENFLSFLCVKQPVHLEYLDISGCWNLGDELLIKLVQRCPNIKHLLLGNLYGLTDRTVCAIAHSCPGLVSLSIVGCWRITDHSISLVAAYCPNLQLLEVKECRDITEESLGPLRKRQVKIDTPGPPPSSFNRLEFLNRAHKINVML